jgi:hypothetical protein
MSDVLDVVEDDLESIQRDLVLAERVGKFALVAGTVVVAGVVVLLVIRRARRRAATETARPPASTAFIVPDESDESDEPAE